MKSIRTSFTLLTMLAVIIAVGAAAAIAVVSVRNLGNSDAEQMLFLMCETGEKNLNYYFDSVEQSVRTVTNIVEDDLVNIGDGEFEDHVSRMRRVFRNAAENTNGVLTYYYRIDPEYSDSVKGFWYTNENGKGFKEHKVTDISLYDTHDTSKLVWFTVPKNTGKAVWLPPYITDNLGVRVISYNVPVYRNSQFVGVVGIEMDYSFIAREVDNITLYDHGYAFLNDSEGGLIYHPKYDVATLTEKTRPKVPAGLVVRDNYTRYTFRGEDKLGVWLPLNNGMRLNVSVPVSEISGRWQDMIWQILLVSVLILLVVCIFNLRYTRRLTKPLGDLTAATEEVNRGNYSVELDYDEDNEVGILTQTFSNLVENLQDKLLALAESEQANNAKTAFLSNMSHEIRTPITTILGMNEIISRENINKNITRCTDNIRKAGTSLLGIISDILDFTKIEAGKLELVFEPYSLMGVIGDLYNMIQFRAEEKGLELRLEIDPRLPSGLVGDELRIKQVITNLLTNAIKYTEAGSVTLTISLSESDDDIATIYVAVSDTGIGIKKEEMDRLFVSFDRLDAVRTRTIEGVGLGLSICRELLQMMGTEMSVSSTYNEGSVFSFYLMQNISDPTPIEEFKEKLVSQGNAEEAGNFNFIAPYSHILIVDDTPMNIEVIKGLLKPTQMKIDVAHSGAECIEKFAVYPYNLVFLDYRMPQMDGIETLEAMKERVPRKVEETPIISLTASAVYGDRERMLDAGFTDYLTKPIIITEMEKMLVKYLPEDEVIFTEEEAKEADTDPLSKIPEAAFSYSWLDPKEGIEYCGTADLYIRAIKLFAKDIDEKAALIERCLSEGDIKQFTIAVHSIKSSALSIGMEVFSGKARTLELAGKNGDEEMIRRDTPAFLEEYRGFKPELERIIGSAE